MADVPGTSTSVRCSCEPTRHDAARGGFSLAELVVALTIGAILATLLFGALAVQVRLARGAAARAAGSDAVRTAAHVLSGEARRMSSGDLRAVSAESVAIRAFRGTAIVCGTNGAHADVRYRGDRLPDPRKDSVIIIAASGTETALALRDARTGTGSCSVSAGEDVQVWTVSDSVADAVMMLLFESGSFYISNRALRYRIGNEGRQPLTAEVFHGTSGFNPAAAPSSLAFHLALRPGRPAHFAPPLAGHTP
jgi:prepilin-type N-terminal cleavage/methylation domain-containing protein